MSKELSKTYDPKDIEDRLYKKWEDNGYFHAEVDRSKKPFTIVMPPPNITGQLHMGHALDNTMQDILIRYKRMQGYNALWIPGTDHAAISTEVKVTNQLKEEGIEVAVVSMPCTELFDKQPIDYQEEILGTAPRIAVEAASKFGWEKYVGLHGDIIGMDGFGASGPAEQLYEYFGITVDEVVDSVKNLIKK